MIEVGRDNYMALLNRYLAELGSMELGRILKVDLWNEVKNLPVDCGILGNITATGYDGIDIDPDIVAAAQERLGANVSCNVMDIRRLHASWTDTFDAVLDLSTIDHVPWSDVPTVLAEYRRVLRADGMLYMGVWLARELIEETIDNCSLTQYCFPAPEFAGALDAAGFHITDLVVTWKSPDETHWFVRLTADGK